MTAPIDVCGPNHKAGAHMSRTLRICWNATASHYLTGVVTNTLIIRKIEANEGHKFEAERLLRVGVPQRPSATYDSLWK